MDNSTIQRDISDIANLFLDADWHLTHFEALQIAVKTQHNKILYDAYVVGHENTPSAFEKIAMELSDILRELKCSFNQK